MTDWSAEILTLAHRIRAERRARRQRNLVAEVEAFLRDHPDASGNAVRLAVRGRKAEVLRAVLTHKERFPERGNHHGGEAA